MAAILLALWVCQFSSLSSLSLQPRYSYSLSASSRLCQPSTDSSYFHNPKGASLSERLAISSEDCLSANLQRSLSATYLNGRHYLQQASYQPPDFSSSSRRQFIRRQCPETAAHCRNQGIYSLLRCDTEMVCSPDFKQPTFPNHCECSSERDIIVRSSPATP